MARTGEFRSDLYHRLNVFRLLLPPLREAKDDLGELVPLFVAEFNAKSGKQVRMIPDEAWRQLRAHDWPGNVRELRNVIERCVLFSEGPLFPVQWLQLTGHIPPAPKTSAVHEEGLYIPLNGSMNLDDMDRHIIQTAVERSGHNIVAAARALGTTRETLRYRIRKYGIDTTAR
jgi:transcriptional regulator with GAF, ATPase, and Fis domain